MKIKFNFKNIKKVRDFGSTKISDNIWPLEMWRRNVLTGEKFCIYTGEKIE